MVRYIKFDLKLHYRQWNRCSSSFEKKISGGGGRGSYTYFQICWGGGGGVVLVCHIDLLYSNVSFSSFPIIFTGFHKRKGGRSLEIQFSIYKFKKNVFCDLPMMLGLPTCNSRSWDKFIMKHNHISQLKRIKLNDIFLFFLAQISINML